VAQAEAEADEEGRAARGEPEVDEDGERREREQEPARREAECGDGARDECCEKRNQDLGFSTIKV
jgi:hypothetical protein